MGDLNKFVQRMRYWCNEANLGYDQSNRWDIRVGGECDCSSLVIHALREAGFDTGSASYTGDLSENLTKRGWKRISPVGTPQVGDILLNDGHHVAACTAPGQMSYASIDENGNARGGKAGDQTDGETKTVNGFYYSRGWNCYLRYGGTTTSEPDKLAVDGVGGYRTIKRLQELVGVKYRDGILSGQLSSCAKYHKAITACTYDGGGSETVKALQRKVGIEDVDGIWGRDTSIAVQGYLNRFGYGLKRDGDFGYISTKALQERLNSGEF